jgi:hypothetical protein
LKQLVPAVLWALLILILCGMPGKDIPHISFLEMLSFDKFVHASLFFVLQCFFAKGLQYKKVPIWDFLLFSAVTSIIYGATLEILQGLVFIDRSADVYDFVANSFGVVMAYTFFEKIDRFVLVKWFH